MYTLLIADDEIDARDNMIACIDWAKFGVEIVGVASDGLTAYELLASRKPDMALVDICMPGMTGLDLIEKARQSGADTLFIIISGYDNFEYAQKAVEYHVNKYLLKPFSPEELGNALQRAIAELPREERRGAEQGQLPDFAAGLLEPEDGELHYSVEQEREIIRCIAGGTRPQMEKLVKDFMRTIRQQNSGPNGVFHCVMLLYSAVCRMLMQRGYPFSSSHFAQQNWQGENGGNALQDALLETCVEAMDSISIASQSNQLICAASGYIDAHYSEKLSLNSIAEQIHISPVYLSNLFTKVVGKSITEYLQGLRIERAKALLLDPEESVADIAEQVGYSDAKYFVQVFKRLTGVTPSTFRSQSSFDRH